MNFWKMNGAGNDFILLTDMERRIPELALPGLARTVCERRLSVGADGLMVFCPAERGGDFRMLFFNSDGSVGEMCGNGARCACRYGYETGLAGRDEQRVETTAGLVTGYYVDGISWRVRLNDPGTVDPERTVEVDGQRYVCAYVELGDPGIPHAVLMTKGLRDRTPDELRPLARALRHHPSFPRGANINFCEAVAPGRVFLRTYERGVEDFTYACGTGSGSVALALYFLGKTGKSVEVENRGGLLLVDIDMDDASGKVENLWLTGPTNVVAKGELTDENVKEWIL